MAVVTKKCYYTNTSFLYNFIFTLDSALSNAHTNVQRLEEECRLKEGYAERVKQMTRSLDQLQKGEL